MNDRMKYNLHYARQRNKFKVSPLERDGICCVLPPRGETQKQGSIIFQSIIYYSRNI